MELVAAEHPLEAGLAATEHPLEATRCRLAADWLDNPQVKHSFVFMRLAADWLGSPLDIDVSTTLQVSVNGSNWHGNASYYIDGEGRGCWNLTFHYKADTSNMKTTLYRQVPDTCTYLCVQSTTSNQWNSMLVLKNA